MIFSDNPLSNLHDQEKENRKCKHYNTEIIALKEEEKNTNTKSSKSGTRTHIDDVRK